MNFKAAVSPRDIVIFLSASVVRSWNPSTGGVGSGVMVGLTDAPLTWIKKDPVPVFPAQDQSNSTDCPEPFLTAFILPFSKTTSPVEQRQLETVYCEGSTTKEFPAESSLLHFKTTCGRSYSSFIVYVLYGPVPFLTAVAEKTLLSMSIEMDE